MLIFVHLYSIEVIGNAECIRIDVNWITYWAFSDPKSIFAIISNGRFIIIGTVGMIFWFLLQERHYGKTRYGTRDMMEPSS